MADTIQTLENLVKLAKKNVEDIQKQIAETLAGIEAFTLKIVTLEKKLEDERKAADTDPFLLVALDRFSKKAEKEITDHKKRRKELQKHEAALRAQLTEQFAEQKRYEILLERKILEKRKRIEKAQQNQMDEIAGTAHQNKADQL